MWSLWNTEKGDVVIMPSHYNDHMITLQDCEGAGTDGWCIVQTS